MGAVDVCTSNSVEAPGNKKADAYEFYIPCSTDYPYISTTNTWKDRICYNTQAYANAGSGPCGSFCKIKADFPPQCPVIPMCNPGGSPLLSDLTFRIEPTYDLTLLGVYTFTLEATLSHFTPLMDKLMAIQRTFKVTITSIC